MKFLIDQQLPRRLANFIRERGHIAQHVKDLALLGAEDRDIWREAQTLGAIIVSKDEDFSLIVRTPGCPQVVWVRLGNCSNNHLFARFDEAWDRLVAELEGGAALIELR